MNLSIDRFETRAVVPRRVRQSVPAIDRLVRERLGRELRRAIEVAWPGGSGVWRIRELQLKLRIPARNLSEDGLAEAWSNALTQQLLTTLRGSASESTRTCYSPSRADWIAEFIAAAVHGRADEWQYAEFEPERQRAVADASMDLILRDPAIALAILEALDRLGTLDPLLRLWPDAHCDRMLRFLSADAPHGKTLSIDVLVEIGTRAVHRRRSTQGGPLDIRRLTLRLMFDELPRSEPLRRLEDVRHAMAVFHILLADGQDPANAGWLEELDAIDVPEWFDRATGAAARRTLVVLRDAARHQPQASKSVLLQILSAVEALRQSSTAPSPPSLNVWRFSSDCAGALLLVAPLLRLGWAERALETRLGVELGPRAVTYLVAAIGLAACGRFSESVDRLDPAIALLAGWSDQPHVGGLREMLASDRPDLRADLLRALAHGGHNHDDARTWASTLQRLAADVIRDFTARIRGFTHASPEFMTRQVLATAGSITVDDARIVVALAASPLHVALHMSSADETVEGVWWLGGRRVEYELEGL
jgi:hypothetical protein